MCFHTKRPAVVESVHTVHWWMAKCGLGLDTIKDTGTSIFSLLLSLAAQKWGIYHTLTQLRLSSSSPILLSAPRPKISLIHPLLLLPNHTPSTLSPGSFPEALLAPPDCKKWKRTLLLSTSYVLHYSDYHKKSYSTRGQHGIRCSSEITSAILHLCLSSLFSFSLQRWKHSSIVYSTERAEPRCRHQWKGYSRELSGWLWEACNDYLHVGAISHGLLFKYIIYIFL